MSMYYSQNLSPHRDSNKRTNEFWQEEPTSSKLIINNSRTESPARKVGFQITIHFSQYIRFSAENPSENVENTYRN